MYVYNLVHKRMYTKKNCKEDTRWQQKIPWKFTLTLYQAGNMLKICII